MAIRLRDWFARLPRLVPSLMLGGAGGALLAWLDLPLAWMLGSMFACLIASMAGAKLTNPRPIRPPMAMVLGLAIGASFHPGLLSQLWAWSLSLSLVVPMALLVTVAGALYFRRIAGFDPRTAVFCALPGGLSEVVLISETLEADAKRIALVHSARIAATISILSLAFAWLVPVPAPGAVAEAPAIALAAGQDLLLLLFVGLAGWLGARAINMPAAAMMGPMLASAIAHGSGFVSGSMPQLAVIAAQIVFGATIGCQFGGVRLGEIAKAVGHGLVFVVMGLAISTAIAFTLAEFMAQSPATIVLAFSVAGATELSLMALTLGLDAPYVVLHHFVRQLSVLLTLPLTKRIVNLLRVGA
ncbi:AbrB family transcriptional regulator [Afifella pfennigii]|uniref:AbrB family transcriptional regulator n=1 Tax=Afifella pfennigii TaxID=209897 RepID=UPI00047C3A12|nr:AbrB family transcriptional regulator [Afifella pfennigii]